MGTTDINRDNEIKELVGISRRRPEQIPNGPPVLPQVTARKSDGGLILDRLWYWELPLFCIFCGRNYKSYIEQQSVMCVKNGLIATIVSVYINCIYVEVTIHRLYFALLGATEKQGQ